MRALASDENFNRKVLEGVLREAPEIDVIRVQKSDLAGANDSDLLSWTAEYKMILLSHDYSTIPFFANERIRAHLPMSGVLMVPQTVSTKQMIDEIVFAMHYFSDDEWDDHVLYLPFR